MARVELNNKQKFERQIHEVLSSALRNEFASPSTQFASIVSVRLTGDYSSAEIFWDCFDPEKREDLSVALTALLPQLRHHLSKLPFRKAPQLRLTYFSQFDDEKQIENLLNKEK